VSDDHVKKAMKTIDGFVFCLLFGAAILLASYTLVATIELEKALHNHAVVIMQNQQHIFRFHGKKK